MTKRYLKRFPAPRSWKIERKTHQWTVRPLPGKHRLEDSIPLIHVVREMLGHADNYREAKRIINEGKILVDGKVVKDLKRGVGLMDIIEIPLTKERYLVLVDSKGSLKLEALKASEGKDKLLKIVNKTVVKGGKIQLNLHDGRNILLDADKAKEYSVNDTLLFNLKNGSIKQHLKYGKGMLAFIMKGAHTGELAKIKTIRKIRSSMPNVVTFEKDKNEFETIENYCFVVGKDKSAVSVIK